MSKTTASGDSRAARHRIVLTLPPQDPENLDGIRNALLAYAGDTDVVLRLPSRDHGDRCLLLGPDFRVNPCEELRARLGEYGLIQGPQTK